MLGPLLALKLGWPRYRLLRLTKLAAWRALHRTFHRLARFDRFIDRHVRGSLIQFFCSLFHKLLRQMLIVFLCNLGYLGRQGLALLVNGQLLG